MALGSIGRAHDLCIRSPHFAFVVRPPLVTLVTRHRGIMRKGRSQRKARASLPPRSARQKADATQVTAPSRMTSRSDAGRADHDPTPEVQTRADVGDQSSVGGRKKTLEMFAEPALELLRQSDRVEAAPVMKESAEQPKHEIPPKRLASLQPLPTPDEMSIPPVGDLAVEPVADRFFSEGE